MAGQIAIETDQISIARKISLGAGDFGINLYWQLASLFLLYFYTDVLGLSAYVAGLIYMSALVWDAAMDPVIGAFADRTRTRYGRFRPYLIFGSIPLAIAFVLVFALPSGDGFSLVALTICGHFLFRTLYALVAVPYASLFARVTKDSAERSTMAGIRMVFAIVAAMVVSATTLPLVRKLGDNGAAWATVAAIFAGLATIALWVAAAAAGRNDRTDTFEDEFHDRPGIASLWNSLIANYPLMLVLAITLLNSFASTFFSKNLLYYFKYVRNDAEFGGTALALMAVLAAVSAPIWAYIARLRSKRFTLLAGSALYALGFALWYLLRDAGYAPLVVSMALVAAGASANAVCFWAMVPDTVEYGQWRSGIRTESLIVGSVVFAQKAALGVAAGALGLALSGIGFSANAVQSEGTIHMLIVMMSLAPLVAACGIFLCGMLYPIDSERHRLLLEEIAARDAPPMPVDAASAVPA